MYVRLLLLLFLQQFVFCVWKYFPAFETEVTDFFDEERLWRVLLWCLYSLFRYIDVVQYTYVHMRIYKCLYINLKKYKQYSNLHPQNILPKYKSNNDYNITIWNQNKWKHLIFFVEMWSEMYWKLNIWKLRNMNHK